MNASPLRSHILSRLNKYLAVALLILAGATATQAQVVRAFTQIFTTNKQADIVIVGNTLHTSSNGAVRANTAASALLINNENWMARVDVDSDTNTFTSSAANYTVPTNGSVMFAKLYWGAGTNAGNNAASGAPNSGLRGQVLLSFNGGPYFSITNTTFDMESSGNRYQGSRDITDFVRTNGSGTYQVANVQSSTGSNTLAGWAIVIAHTDPAAPPRNIALFDGYAVVSSSAANVDIPISGFTTPQFNAVVTRVGVVAYEGDSGLAGGVYTGDQMRMNGVHLPKVVDANTATNDVFNSTITRLGSRVSTKNPDYTNQLGFDIKVLDATGVLTNTATSATITLTTGGEQYYPGAVAFATELYAPQITIPKTVSDVNGGAINPGDVLLYNLSVTNSGGDWATNVFLIDPVPPGTSYVTNTFQITGGANIGPKTDGKDADQLDFTNGVLTVRIGMGANGTNGGVLSTNQSTSMSFMVRVGTNAMHGLRITNQATLSYSALVTGVAFASASTLAEVQVEAGIFGRVFEDVNYSGGAGRNYVSSAGVGLANARIELYGPLNNFLATTLTDPNGSYVFSNISANAYSIRVVNSSVVSSRAGGGTPGLVPVPTFRTDANSGAAVELVNLVGGATPGATDPANGVFTGAQSLSAVSVTNNLYTGGVDFGFNFNTIVSTNNSGPGSARQFITNVNALVGLDRAVIMIPDGTAAPGLNPSFDFTVGGFRTLAPSTPLPAITDAVLFDATTVAGYAGTPLVRLSGVNAGAGANGLVFNSSGSTLSGVAIHSFSGSGVVLAGGTNNTIAANVLGADPTGLIALPNGTGVLIATNATNNLVGGTTAGAANLIAFNTGAGIAVTGTTNVGNQIRRNSIFSNGGLGIDLNNNGVTLNDLNDADTGGNTLFNSPVITNAIISGANLVLNGYARPGSVIELFIAEPDATGFGEGRTYLATVTEGASDADATSGTYSGTINGLNQGTDNTARFSFTIPLPPGVSVGTWLTATATDAAGNTSEFGGNAPVGGFADLVVAKSGPATTTSQSAIAYTLNVTNNGPATAVNVVVFDTLPAGVTFVSASSGGTLSNNIVSWPVLTNLASGARTNYSVTVTAPIGGSITNVASGDLDNVDPTPGNNDGSSTNARVVTAVTPQADVAVNVSGPATVLAGENYTYTITVANFGPATATNIITTNLLPVGVTYVTGTGVASVGGNTVTFNTVTLASNDVATFTVTVTAPASGSLTNRASGAAVTPDPVVANNNGSAVGAIVLTTVTPQADVAVGKSGPATVLAGSNFTYTISVTNFGPSTASNVVASDSLPASLVFVSANSGGVLGTNNVVSWPALTLLSGARTNYTLTVTAPAGGAFTNFASATSPTGDPNPTNNVGTNTGAQVTTTVTPQADIVVTVSGPTNVLAGGSYTYTVSVTNLGVSGATNVLATNTLPGGVVFISTSGGGTNTGSTVTWPTIDLPAGTGTNFTITVTAPPSGSLTNRAAGASITPDPIASNNNGSASTAVVITTVTPQADVAVAKTGPATMLAGGNLTYTISITNFGPSTASNIVAQDNLPATALFVSAGSGGTLGGGNIVTWPATTLLSGATTNFTVTVTAPASGSLVNRASATSPTGDPNPTNNVGTNVESVVTTTVTPQADVAVGKSGPATVLAGANVIYTINVTNFGPSTASNIIAQDFLPTNATFVSASGGGTLAASNIVSWPATTLLANGVTNLTVTVTAPASGSLLNRAAANSPTGDPNPTNNLGTNTGAQVTTSVTPQADLAVTVTGPSTVLAGATYTYTVSITNLGPSVATNALATNALPPGVVFVSATGGGTPSGGNVTWPALELASGASTSFVITVTAPPSGLLTNRASGASSTADPILANNNGTAAGAVVVTTVTPQADVAVGKSGPAGVSAGANFSYTISITNLGPSTASNVVAVDNLPAAVTLVSASGGGLLGGGNVVTWPATTLLSGAVTNFTVTVTAPVSGQFTNIASASSPTGDPNPTNNVGTNGGAQVVTTIGVLADVAVTVSGPATVLAGATYTYTVSVTNFGPSTATNALATNALPGGVVFVSTTGGGSQSGGNVTWPAITLPGGAGTNFVITVTAPPSGVLTNRAAGSSLTPDPDFSNNDGSTSGAIVTTTVTPQADVAVGKIGPANVLAGANLTYTLSVTNFGPSTASNIIAQDFLPTNATFVSASSGGTLGASNIVSWPATTLLSGGVTNFTVTVTAPASGSLFNRASASSPTGDPNPTNNVGTNTGALVTTTVTPQADLAVTVAGPSGILAGGSYTYTVSITNLGPSVATNALATNALPAGVTFVSTTGGGSQSAGNVTWPAITLASGAGTNFTITVTAPPSGVLTNTAAGASLTPDPDLSNNNGSASGAVVVTTVTPQADVAVGKSGPATVLAGANVTYTISVTNFGPSIASNIIAQDNLPTNATFVSASSGGTLGASNTVTWPATTLLSGGVTNFTVTITAPANGSLLNRASANSPTGDPNPTNNVGTNTGALVTTTVTPQADLVVLVSGPSTVLAGATYTYTVSITNLGPSVATNALATNALPAGVGFVSTTGGGTQSGGNVTWPSITLASGAGTSFIITVTAPPSGTLINTAAGASLTADPVLTNNNGTASGAIVTTTVTPQADIAVGKSGPATVLAGANVTYTISVTNLGPSTASNVSASDTLPVNATFVSASFGGVLSNGIVTWPGTNLLSGQRQSYTVTVQAPANGGTLFNTASATSPTGDPNPTNNVGTNASAQVTTTVTPQADVAVSKSGPATVLAAQNLTYTITVTNLGPSTASNVIAQDNLPATATFVSASGGGALGTNNIVAWPATTLLSGAATTFTVTVTAPASGSLTNRASATSPTGDPNPTNNVGTNAESVVTTTVTPQADVAVGKSGPAGVTAGANFTYTISVTNFGPSTASNVVAVDNLPASVTFVSASGSGTLGGGNIVSWPATTLAANAVTNFTVTVTAPASGQFTNIASASSPTGDPNPTNNVGTNAGAQVVTTIGVLADVAVTVSGPGVVLAGGTYTYTVSVTNFGPSTATNALATNALPGGVVFVSSTGGGTQSGGAVTWPPITLASGSGTNFTITVTAPPSGVLTNRAAGSSLTPDPDLSNNNGSASGAIVTTTVTPQADVAVAKTGPATVLAGANVTYTISVTNFGPSIASNIVAQDFLPTNATFVSASSGGTLGASNIVTWPATTLLSGGVTNFTVTITAPASGSLLNRASANSPTGDPNPTNNVGTNTGALVTTTVTPQADLVVLVSGPSTVLAGASYTYTVSITNLGPSVATNALATNALPPGVGFISTTGGGTQSGGNVTWPAITLASGAGTSFTITVTAPPGGTLINTASGASLTTDPVLANNNGSASGAIVTTTVTPQADVAVAKTGPATVLAGANLTYTISVTNFGPSTASGVIAQDFLPTNATFVSASSGGTLGVSNIVSWPATTLAANTVTNFTITITAPASGSLFNRAAANSPTGDPNPTNNVGTNTGSQVTTTVTPQADVALGKSGPSTVLAGANFTYTISVTNFGPSTASNVAVLDNLPATVTFVSASAGATVDASDVSWTVPSLLSGAVTNFTVTVTAPPSGSFTNRATASSPTGDPNPGNNSSTNGGGQVTTTVTPQADVAVGKSGPATVLAGANLTYTISVTNFGPSTASNIVTVDTLPANATFVSASGGGTLGGGNVVTWPATTLISGATATFTVTVTAPASGSLFNSASATSPTSDPNPTNNVGTNTGAQVSTAVTPLADIVVTVSGPTNALAGSNITYTISITNFGPSIATNAVVTNTLPGGVTFVSANGGGTQTNGVVTWPVLPTLGAGEGTNFIIIVTVPGSGVLTNRTGGGSLTTDPNLANNNASSPGGIATTTITPQADVAVGKSGPASVPAGSNIVYVISITNYGPSTASNVVTVDQLPASVTFVSASGGGSLSEGNQVIWPATTLVSGAVTNFTVTVTAPASGSITNVASSTSPTGDPNPGNNSSTNGGGRVVTTILSGPSFGVRTAPAVFNPQTGLFEQRVTVTNIGLSTVAAVRLSVTSLSTNATFHNPSGNNDGVPYAQYNSPLNPGQTVLFTLEFLVPNRRPFTNTLAVEAVLPVAAGTNSGAGGINISRAFVDARPPNAPRFVIEFPSQVGRVYTVLYRDNLSSPWKVATPSVTAGSTSTQWYDDGPPKTDGPPLTNGSRYYRVIVAPLDL